MRKRPGFRAGFVKQLKSKKSENDVFSNEHIRADFNELCHKMNGIPLREMDKIIYPVCTLCRDPEKAGFTEGVKIGILLKTKLE